MKYLDAKVNEGTPVDIELREGERKDGDKVLAFAKFIVYDEDVATLWYIQSNEKGSGARLLELALDYLKERYDITKVYTDWKASTKGGREVCLKCGFKRKQHLLVWEA